MRREGRPHLESVNLAEQLRQSPRVLLLHELYATLAVGARRRCGDGVSYNHCVTQDGSNIGHTRIALTKSRKLSNKCAPNEERVLKVVTRSANRCESRKHERCLAGIAHIAGGIPPSPAGPASESTNRGSCSSCRGAITGSTTPCGRQANQCAHVGVANKRGGAVR